MKNYHFIIAFVLYCLWLPSTVMSLDVQQSHIKGNLPDTFEQFTSILDRDLQTYFSQKYKTNIKITYELLRREPTQSGVAYPKFYAWVIVQKGNEIIDSGAVRVAAIEKVRIEVTEFVSKKEIIQAPKSIEAIFPMLLCDTIRKRAGVK